MDAPILGVCISQMLFFFLLGRRRTMVWSCTSLPKALLLFLSFTIFNFAHCLYMLFSNISHLSFTVIVGLLSLHLKFQEKSTKLPT